LITSPERNDMSELEETEAKRAELFKRWTELVPEWEKVSRELMEVDKKLRELRRENGL
jgi:hypothetical protein